MQLTSTSAVIKEIEYDRETKDYAAFVTIDERREYIGSRRSYGEADRLCDEYAYHHFADNHTPEVAAQIAVEMSEAAPFTDACPSCGDQLTWEGPGLCGACRDERPNAIALALTGTASPTCELCNAPAFVSIDGRLYCKAQWQQGKCDEPTPYCFFHPDASDHNTRDCPKVEEPGFGEPSYSVFN